MVEQKHIHSYVECINFTKNIIGRIKRRIIQELHYLITLLGFDMLWEIKDISMEMCTQCNINCIYCGADNPSKRKKFMDIELYEKLLKELSKSNFRIRLFSLGLTAEAGLHPQFKDFVMLTKKYINKGFSPKHIAISTNLMSMNKKLVDFIVESRVIDMITCSIDGKDKKSSERLKWGIKYETVLKNLDYLLEKNKKDGHPIEITINNGNDDESETKSIDLELKKRFKRADKVVNFKFHEWNGTKIRIKKLVKNKKRGFCYFTFRMIILTVDGLIGKCCYDQNGNTTYGDFNKYSLQEIYNSKQRKIDLKNLHRKRRDLVKGCEKCNTI